MSKRLNSYDVARAAGVSRTVVSLVMNGKADKYGVARKTQDRVRAAIRQTGYVPNMFIRDLFLKRREVIEVGGTGAAPDPVNVSVVVNPALAAAGYRVQVSTLAADPAAAASQITALLHSGLVVMIAPEAAAARKEWEVSSGVDAAVPATSDRAGDGAVHLEEVLRQPGVAPDSEQPAPQPIQPSSGAASVEPESAPTTLPHAATTPSTIQPSTIPLPPTPAPVEPPPPEPVVAPEPASTENPSVVAASDPEMEGGAPSPPEPDEEPIRPELATEPDPVDASPTTAGPTSRRAARWTPLLDRLRQQRR